MSVKLTALEVFLFTTIATGSFVVSSLVWPEPVQDQVAGAGAPASQPAAPRAAGSMAPSDPGRTGRLASQALASAYLQGEPTASRVRLPPLTALDLEILRSRPAGSLKGALLQAISTQIFSEPSCIPPDHQDVTVVQFDLLVRSTAKEGIVKGIRSLRIIDGPLVSDAVLSCLRGRLPQPMVVDATGADAFPVFEGDAAVRAFLTSNCKR